LADTGTAVETAFVANTVLWQGFTLAEASGSVTPIASSSASNNQPNTALGTEVRAAPTYSGASVSILDITPSAGLPGAELGARVASNNLPSYRFMVSDLSNVYFRVLPVETMAMPELEKVLQSRRAYKKSLFSNAIALLEKDPALPNLVGCELAAQAGSGACLADPADAMFKTPVSGEPKRAARRVDMAAVPQIGRKVAVVVGINKYDDKRIPQLIGAVPDANAVSGLLRDQLGYDVVLLTNPNKAEIFKALNSIAVGLKEDDSLLVYYAGHGEMVDKTGMGYWIPGDANADNPVGWVSNADLNQLLARSKSKQMAVVADSCYSGRFTAEGKVAEGQATPRIEDLLLRRAVTMMSSGGDEPVADTGKEGHSIFAWNLMKKIREVSSWTSGSNVFETVRTAVERELPQTPQYGASLAAGHEPGADFLFERRNWVEAHR